MVLGQEFFPERVLGLNALRVFAMILIVFRSVVLLATISCFGKGMDNNEYTLYGRDFGAAGASGGAGGGFGADSGAASPRPFGGESLESINERQRREAAAYDAWWDDYTRSRGLNRLGLPDPEARRQMEEDKARRELAASGRDFGAPGSDERRASIARLRDQAEYVRRQLGDDFDIGDTAKAAADMLSGRFDGFVSKSTPRMDAALADIADKLEAHYRTARESRNVAEVVMEGIGMGNSIFACAVAFFYIICGIVGWVVLRLNEDDELKGKEEQRQRKATERPRLGYMFQICSLPLSRLRSAFAASAENGVEIPNSTCTPLKMKTLLASLAVSAECVVVIIIGSIYAEATGHRTIPGLLWIILFAVASWTWRTIRAPSDKFKGEKSTVATNPPDRVRTGIVLVAFGFCISIFLY